MASKARVSVALVAVGSIACGSTEEIVLEELRLASAEQSITDGALINATQNTWGFDPSDITKPPYGAAVSLGGACTAVKIGPRRYLTADHCYGPPGSGTRIRISNGLVRPGTSAPDYGITAQYAHPSNNPSLLSVQGSACSDGACENRYDAEIFEIDTDLPDIPTAELTNWRPHNQLTLIGVGYGCNRNLNPDTMEDKKQLGVFQAAIPSPTNPEDVRYLVNRSQTTDLGCQGDSGGPAFAWNPNAEEWQVVGIFSYSSTTSGSFRTGFTAIGNIADWLFLPSNPINNFVNNAFGVFINSQRGSCATPSSTATTAGLPIQVYPCDRPRGDLTGKPPYWVLTRVAADNYTIRNLETQRCMGSTSNGLDVQQFACDGAARLSWRFVRVGVASSPLYQVRSNASSRCLAAGGTVDSDLSLATCSTTVAGQHWIFSF